jgi:hypothetical protein
MGKNEKVTCLNVKNAYFRFVGIKLCNGLVSYPLISLGKLMLI